MRIARSSDVTEKKVGADLALYVGAHRAIHVLNETARILWAALEEPLAFDEIFFVMQDVFEAEPDTLREDLHTAIDELVALGILVNVVDGHEPPLP